MKPSLLRAKISMPPVRPDLVKRMHLIERLNDGLFHDNLFTRRFTLISAPAGYGKTTLVRQWMSHWEFRGGCFSLDEGDNDPAIFWTYLVSSFQTVYPNLGINLMTFLSSFTFASGELSSKGFYLSEYLLTDFINDLMEIPEPMVLILDNLHLITDSNILNSLVFLIENLPPKVHLMITSRNDPPWPLVRWRARGDMVEIRQEDLRFTQKEADRFLHEIMHLELSSQNVSSLTSRTEGWITGLQMAAISMRGKDDFDAFTKAFTGSNRFVLDYLREEVLQSQPELIKKFLLQTSILGSFTDSLCDAVIGRDGSLEVLEILEGANLFIIPLDDERKWYRYHSLFADLLRRQLLLTNPQLIPQLNLRASKWYEKNGFFAEAIDRAVTAGELGKASDILNNHIDALWQQCGYIRVNLWLETLPDEHIQKRPLLCLMHAIMFLMSARIKEAEERLMDAERYIESENNSSANRTQESDDKANSILLGIAAVIHGYIAIFKGDITAIGHYSRQALQYLPPGNMWRCSALITLGDALVLQGDVDAANGAYQDALNEGKSMTNAFCVLFAGYKLGIHLWNQGRLEDVAKLCESELLYAEENSFSRFPRAGSLWGMWGEIKRERGQLNEALEYTQKGCALSKSEETVLAGCSLCLLRVLFSMKEYEEAEKKLKELEILMGQSTLPIWLVNLITSLKARLCIAKGDLKSAEKWVEGRKQQGDLNFSPMCDSENLVLVRFMWASDQLEESFQYLGRFYDAVKNEQRLKTVIEVLILKSMISQEMKCESEALAALMEALTLAEPEGYIQVFIDESQPMKRLLKKAIEYNMASAYAGRLLIAFPALEPDETPESSSLSIQEPLSNREMEVLALMANGLTNQDIAKRLFLSLSTVKWHTSNIYGKLDVENRTGAVARARALGIL
ncbi:MAG: ATP-dependent transcriptional regulator [Clostridia bacterium]|jgi:LuxR family maltose regulon positive regulatory protein|nr:ATP-dependent transcriptional regulator [Clostridia bacterium]